MARRELHELELVQRAQRCLAGIEVTHTGPALPERRRRILTLPHASPAFSGRTSALAMVSEIDASQPVLLVGFRHDGTSAGCRTDHSVQHVHAMLTAYGCTQVDVHCAEHAGKLASWPSKYAQVVVSTDFSHLNGDRAGANVPVMDVAAICRQDTAGSVTVLNARRGTWQSHPWYHLSCGRRAGAVVQPWAAQWHVLYYENSHPDVAKGVGYAVLRGFDASVPRLPWKATLDSAVLAWAHLRHVWAALVRGDMALPRLCWSPLLAMPGSCFITLYGNARQDVLACFGGWEEHHTNMWSALTAAFSHVRTARWREDLSPNEAPNKMAQLSLTLIAPHKEWTTSEVCVRQQGCRVQGSATYLGSVWETFRTVADFTRHLRQKAARAGAAATAPLEVYDEVVWRATQDPRGSW